MKVVHGNRQLRKVMWLFHCPRLVKVIGQLVSAGSEHRYKRKLLEMLFVISLT